MFLRFIIFCLVHFEFYSKILKISSLEEHTAVETYHPTTTTMLTFNYNNNSHGKISNFYFSRAENLIYGMCDHS
jgi:hypothetical protein